ncbi:hypothetical protein [Virgibacillus siamensis]|uniref:hypothetical protein n=1 Tax=Virgibacillus siamensis TaxID=480071 RepID=UPI000984F225|nr:hypothetical protein [Virgibacillus siamensis]
MKRYENQSFSELKWRFHKPNYVLIAFDEFDLFYRGFYSLEQDLVDKHLYSITTPDMVLKNEQDEELWLNNYKCGYGGTGAHNSESLLKKCNIPNEFIDKVFSHDVFELKRHNDLFNFSGVSNSVFRNQSFSLNNVYSDGEKIIFIQEADPFNRKLNTTSQDRMFDFISKYRQFFLSTITRISIFPTKQDAVSRGYYKKNIYRNHNKIFQLIIENEYEQMWLNPLFEKKSNVLLEPEIQNILEVLDVTVNTKVRPKLEWVKENIFNHAAEPLVINVEQKG